MLFPGPQQSVFWFDFEGLTDGNLFKDLGPYGLHATPQAGFVAPNFGLARNAHGKGYANFTGAANCYATLPLRFYQYAPTREYTWVMYASHTDLAGTVNFFSCDNNAAGGVWKGLILQGVADGRCSVRSGQAIAALPTSDVAGASVVQRRNVIIATWETTPKCWVNRAPLATSWTAGGFGTTVYDATMVPGIGGRPGGIGLVAGITGFFAFFPFVFTDSEAKAMSAWLMDQV